MAEVVKVIPNELDVDSLYAVRVRTINAFGAASQWSESLVVDTNVGFRRFVWTDNGPVYYFENGKVLFSLYESDTIRKNYLKNPSFENSITGYTRVGTAGQVSIAASTTALFGTGSMYVKKLVSTAAAYGFVTTSAHYVASVPGDRWVVSAYARPSIAHTFSAVTVNFYKSDLTLISKSVATYYETTVNSWVRMQSIGTAPALTAWVGVEVLMYSSTPINAEWRYDGLMLEKGDVSLGSYFDGSTGADSTWDGAAHDSSSTQAANAALITINKDVHIGGSYDGILNIFKEGGTIPAMYFDSGAGDWGSRHGSTLRLRDTNDLVKFKVDGSTGDTTIYGGEFFMWNTVVGGFDKFYVSGTTTPTEMVLAASDATYIQWVNTGVMTYWNGSTAIGGLQRSGTAMQLIGYAGTLLVSSAASMTIQTISGNIVINPAGSTTEVISSLYCWNTVRAWGAGAFSLLGNNDSAYISFYHDATDINTPGTRTGYFGHPGSIHMYLINEKAGGSLVLEGQANIDYYSGSVYQARLSSGGDFLVSKTATDTTTIGVAVLGVGRVYTTAGNATAYNYITNIPAAQSGDVHLNFRRTDAIIGSVTTTAALTGVAYNVTSDMTMKGGVLEIDDDEALSIIEKLHPVRYQWRYDKDGEPTPEGEPKGPYDLGFLAQELYEVVPVAVTPGKGKWSDHKKWLEKKRKYSVIAQKHEEFSRLKTDEQKRRTAPPPLPENPDKDKPPFEPWMNDNSKLVPLLASGMQALIRRVDKVETSNKQQKEIDDLKKEITWLRELIEKK